MNRLVDDPRVASIPVQALWIDEALAELNSYTTEPFINEFMTRFELKPDNFKNKKKKMKKIRRCIRARKHRLKFDDLVAYMDELKPYGRQMVFLWRLKPGQENYLSQLADQNHVNNLHVDQRPADSLNYHKLIWQTPTPELAEVNHSDINHEGLLKFKWVASRNYFVKKTSPNGRQPPGFVRKSQRAVTFFAVNLRNGDCELRIQSLPDGVGVRDPQDEFKMYRAEVEKFVKLDHFAPVLIEPFAKYFLRELALPITTWYVLRPRGGFLKGNWSEATRLRNMLRVIGECFARQITVRWDCEQNTTRRSLFFSLDGCGDSIEFGGISDASRIDFVLDKIRHYTLLSVQLPELRRKVEEYPEYSRIISSMDDHFVRLMRLRIDAEDLSRDVWYPKKKVLKVFRLVADEFPELFSMSEEDGDVLVMSNKFRLRTGAVDPLKRHAMNKGKRREAALVKPTMTVGYLILNFLSERLVSWMLSTLFKRLTGVPFVIVDIVLVLFIALLYAMVIYGKDCVKVVLTSVPKGTFTILRWLALSLSKRQLAKITEAVEEEYIEWAGGAANGSMPNKYFLESRS